MFVIIGKKYPWCFDSLVGFMTWMYFDSMISFVNVPTFFSSVSYTEMMKVSLMEDFLFDDSFVDVSIVYTLDFVRIELNNWMNVGCDAVYKIVFRIGACLGYFRISYTVVAIRSVPVLNPKIL